RDVRLCGELVFVDQSAKDVPALEAIEVDHVGRCVLIARRRLCERWTLAKRTVRPMLVVVDRVDGEDALEMTPADDQDPVEALAAYGADPALGVRPRLRRPHGCLDHPDAFGAEDLVELAGEVAVAVTDKAKRPTGAVVVELH